MNIEFTVNGERRNATVAGWESLLRVLRDALGLAGSKNACEQGECGSCTVVLDGELVCSCLVMAGDCEGAVISTVEGIAHGDELDAVQQVMLDAGGVQCGFCTPGFVVAARYLFDRDPSPTELDIREALSGNICRCTGYGGILRGLEALGAGHAGPAGEER